VMCVCASSMSRAARADGDRIARTSLLALENPGFLAPAAHREISGASPEISIEPNPLRV
jgi:hypothetical protein